MSIRDEKLNDYMDLVAWARNAGLLPDAEARTILRKSYLEHEHGIAVFKRAIRLRETLYRIFKAILARKPPAQADLSALNEELRKARVVEHLGIAESVLEWQWHAPLSTLEAALWAVARDILTNGDLSRLRQCDGYDCGWIFEDTTRNRSRRWCDMRDCGNRASEKISATPTRQPHSHTQAIDMTRSVLLCTWLKLDPLYRARFDRLLPPMGDATAST